MPAAMQFAPFVSDIELPFYTSLASHKINHDKLDDSARKLLGLYEIRAANAPEHSCRMQIHGNALTSDEVPAGYYRGEGMIKNFNTIEEFRNPDNKKTLLNLAGKTIWDAIKDGTIYSVPSLLSSFIVLSFADLKKYKFSYWFAFPALHAEPAWKQTAGVEPQQLSGVETSALVDSVQTWRYGVDSRQHGFFLAKKVKLAPRFEPDRLDECTDDQDIDQRQQTTPTTTTPPNLGFTWSISSLASYETGFFGNTEPEDRFICFADPSNYPKGPGWMLRNLLVLINERFDTNKVQVMCYRDVQNRRDEGRSFVLSLQKQPPKSNTKITDTLNVTGWERNASGKLMPKIANLTEYMDPQRLADQSVDLNLKLMKWRIAPQLDLEKIKATRCLLLGAGTLGSYVARMLMGWGVRKITFVDNATVSYSNPVRQPLFDFKDCLDGGAKKASRAAEALLEIYPGVESEGHVISVPMAGHPVTDVTKVHEEYDSLRKLIENHDAIFLLMDTRESRWLPTVMGKAAGKIVLNAALGFDTFVVMRHGIRLEDREQELGCYFCNDVVAPADSLSDRTLDQQCTVTRPGAAPLASALLVELLVSVLQHPLGAAAPASSFEGERDGHSLGIVPHQIRGFLATFSILNVFGKSYHCCSACSDRVVNEYQEKGWEFIQKALNEKDYVEELSGLKEVQRAADAAAQDIDWEEGDSDIGEGEGELI